MLHTGEIRAAMLEGMSAPGIDGLRRGLHAIVSNLERLERLGARAEGEAP